MVKKILWFNCNFRQPKCDLGKAGSSHCQNVQVGPFMLLWNTMKHINVKYFVWKGRNPCILDPGKEPWQGPYQRGVGKVGLYYQVFPHHHHHHHTITPEGSGQGWSSHQVSLHHQSFPHYHHHNHHLHHQRSHHQVPPHHHSSPHNISSSDMQTPRWMQHSTTRTVNHGEKETSISDPNMQTPWRWSWFWPDWWLIHWFFDWFFDWFFGWFFRETPDRCSGSGWGRWQGGEKPWLLYRQVKQTSSLCLSSKSVQAD